MRQCSICAKGSVIRGKRKLLRGHYNPLPTSRRYPNIQWAKVDGIRSKVCTSCMKKLPSRVAMKAPAKKEAVAV